MRRTLFPLITAFFLLPGCASGPAPSPAEPDPAREAAEPVEAVEEEAVEAVEVVEEEVEAVEAVEEEAGAVPASVLYPFQGDSLWGYLDETGTVRIGPRYQEAGHFHQGLARVRAGDTIRFIEPGGAVRFETTELWVREFSGGLAPARRRGDGSRWGYIDEGGGWVIAPRYTHAYPFSEGKAAVYTGDAATAEARWGYIDRRGDWVIEPRFWGARRFSGGLAPVEVGGFVGGQWGYVDETGAMAIEPAWEEALPFSGGLAAVSRDGPGFDDEWGYIDRSGDVAIPLGYTLARSFDDGVAAVRDAMDRWHFITPSGEKALAESYGVADRFRGALARVAEDGDVGFGHQGGAMDYYIGGSDWRWIDREGRQVYPEPGPEAAGEAVALTYETLAPTLPGELPGGLVLQEVEEGGGLPGSVTGVYAGGGAGLEVVLMPARGLMRQSMIQEMTRRAASSDEVREGTLRDHTLFEGRNGDRYQMVAVTDRLIIMARGELPEDVVRAAFDGLDWAALEALDAGG